MEYKLLPIILQHLPQRQRPNAVRQLDYYESQVEYWSIERGKKFKFTRDEISLLLQAAIFYQHIYVALEDSSAFFNRMSKYEVSSIKAGNLTMNGGSVAEIRKLSNDFRGVINSFFSSHKVDAEIEILGFEDIKDFIKFIEK